MFTILHKYGNGIEVLYEAIEVTKRLAEQRASSDGPEFDLYITLPAGHPAKSVTIPFDTPGPQRANGPWPEVIVMNGNGKTVAKYDL